MICFLYKSAEFYSKKYCHRKKLDKGIKNVTKKSNNNFSLTKPRLQVKKMAEQLIVIDEIGHNQQKKTFYRLMLSFG